MESIQSCVQSKPKFKEPITKNPIDTGGYPIEMMEALDMLLSANLDHQVFDFHPVKRFLSDDDLESLSKPRILTPAPIHNDQYLANHL